MFSPFLFTAVIFFRFLKDDQFVLRMTKKIERRYGLCQCTGYAS